MPIWSGISFSFTMKTIGPIVKIAVKGVPSLKLTASLPLKINEVGSSGSDELSFLDFVHFQVLLLLVSGIRESKPNPIQSQNTKPPSRP